MTLPRSADAVRGGELSHAFACASEASSVWPVMGSVGNPCRNGTRRPVDVVGCATFVSPRKPASGAPTATANTTATRSLFMVIDEALPVGVGAHDAPVF